MRYFFEKPQKYSRYEPWGYTPLESIAFSVPTITSTLAGFGVWALSQEEHEGIVVIERNDTNADQAAQATADAMLRFAALNAKEVAVVRKSAGEVAKRALWCNMFKHYMNAYDIAIESCTSRTNRAVLGDGGAYNEQINFVRQQLTAERPNWQRMMIEKTLPARLHPLEELSRNLWWSWTLGARCADQNRDRIANRDAFIGLYVANGRDTALAFLAAVKAPPAQARIAANSARTPADAPDVRSRLAACRTPEELAAFAVANARELAETR